MAGLEAPSTSGDLGSKNSSIILVIISFQRQEDIQVKSCISISVQEGVPTPSPHAGENWENNSCPSLSLLLPPSCSSFHGKSQSSDWSGPRVFTESSSPLSSITWAKKSSSGMSGFQIATRSDQAYFPREGPAVPSLGSTFSTCNWVDEPSASLISKTYDSFFLQSPPSSCTPSPHQKSQMQPTKFSFSSRVEMMKLS